MDSAKRAALEKKLAQLRDFYIQGLPAEFEKLEKSLSLVKPGLSSREVIAEIHQAMHKFAGSGGSFGLNELSKDARKIEQELLSWLKTEESIFPADKSESLQQSIADLKKDIGLHDAEDKEQELTAEHEFRNKDMKISPSQEKKICLLENDKNLYEKLVHELGSFSFNVIPFDAIEKLSSIQQDSHADLVVIDLELLEFDPETHQFLLPVKLKDKKIPFLVIGSKDDFGTRLAIARLGAAGYFVTPFDISDLIKRANQVFEKQSAAPGRVLIVDDDLQLACHYKLVLESVDILVDFVIQPEEMMLKIESFKPELVLMDLNMPDVSGRDLAGVIRQYKRYASLPIVFLSAETEFNLQLNALFHGADEFLTKPISDEQLILAVHARIERARVLEELITKDGLTGLFTHSNIKEMAEYELKRAKRNSTTYCFAMLDIDRFKSVNDTYGHAIGDMVIASLATLLKQRLRNTDLIGRYGGEEFLLILPDCDMDEAFVLLEKIRKLFSKIEFQKGSETFFSSVSIGVACTSQVLRCEADQLINMADKALYQAKNSGRNRTVLFSENDPGL